MRYHCLRALTFVFVAFLATLLPGCSGGEHEIKEDLSAGKAKSLRVGYLSIIPSLPLLLAYESGAFERERLDVELVRFNTSNDVMSALLAEKIDVYFLASSSITLLIEEQRPGFTKSLMVNMNTKDRPLDYLVARKEGAIDQLQDLNGKKVGIFPGTTMRGFLVSALRSNGVEPKSVEIIELPPPEQINALVGGRVDALLALEPVPTQALSTGKVKIVSRGVVENYVINPWIGGTVTVRDAYLQQNRDAVDAFDQAVRGVLPSLGQPNDENLGVLAKYTAITPDVARKVGFVEWVSRDRIPRKKFQELADKLYDVGVLKRKVDTSGMFLE